MTRTITITDLADVLPGDMVTAEYVPSASGGEFGATIIGQASATYGGLVVGGFYLRFEGGAACTVLRFVSATREVPVWEPDRNLRDWLADQLEEYDVLGGDPRHAARSILTYLHDNGWLNDTPADPAPVDPVLDETDKRDRIDSDGDRWRWSGDDAVWWLGNYAARGNLATLDRRYGPPRFADEETEA